MLAWTVGTAAEAKATVCSWISPKISVRAATSSALFCG